MERLSPRGSPVPGILQARTLECVAISFSNAWKWKVKVKWLSLVWLLATPWTASHLLTETSFGFSVPARLPDLVVSFIGTSFPWLWIPSICCLFPNSYLQAKHQVWAPSSNISPLHLVSQVALSSQTKTESHFPSELPSQSDLPTQWFKPESQELIRRRQWHPTPALLPGKSHRWRSLVGRSPWGR